MITQKDVGQLLAVYRSDTWQSLLKLIDEMALKWQMEAQTGNAEWEYLRDNLLRDGRIEGMKLLMKEIERIAQKNL